MSKPTYVRGYEVKSVSPLPHYFEEIYGHNSGIAKIGPRGDNNYFWYSKDENGAAYYEISEQKKSAESTYEFFKNSKNRTSYLRNAADVIERSKKLVNQFQTFNLPETSTTELVKFQKSAFLLDADIFSCYLISQPYRMQMLEEKVRWELKKRVAVSRIDLYLARLTAPGELTMTLEEERDWAKLLLDGQKYDFAEMEPKILRHYDTYKSLTLGDGQWELNPEIEIKRYKEDVIKDTSRLKARIQEIDQYTAMTLRERKMLIKELYLESDTVELIDFLAQVAHTRYAMRTEGFIPIIYVAGEVVVEFSARIGYDNFKDYGFMNIDEFWKLIANPKSIVPLAEIKKRRGEHDEYMVRINEGVVEWIYGEAAGKLLRKLVPTVDHSKIIELSGIVAQQGKLEATVTVYNWGDDLGHAIETIRKHPILVAGQTRPAMMPLIRESKGIVTDEGGVTSHAAIVARELKIPTVINTQNATKVFKTGDRVILDADHGIIQKVET